jgi:hypothetical protein
MPSKIAIVVRKTLPGTDSREAFWMPCCNSPLGGPVVADTKQANLA